MQSNHMHAAAWLCTGLTVGGAGVFILIAAIDPVHFDSLSRKDDLGDTGLFEHLTVLTLVAAIAASIFALLFWRRRLPSRKVAAWFAIWTLACVYFAGEESSWGQWYLGYETPAFFEQFNDQGETNLHNMSSWLDQKPRAAVKVFIILAGLIIPTWLWLRWPDEHAEHEQHASFNRPEAIVWIVAPSMCWAAAAVVLIQRISSWIDVPTLQRIGTSEFRELGIAWFLSLYLLSYVLRMYAADDRTTTSDPLAT